MYQRTAHWRFPFTWQYVCYCYGNRGDSPQRNLHVKKQFRRMGRLLHAFGDLQESLLPSPRLFCYLYLIQKNVFSSWFQALPNQHTLSQVWQARSLEWGKSQQWRNRRSYWWGQCLGLFQGSVVSVGTPADTLSRNSHMYHHSCVHCKMQINCLPQEKML